MRYTFHNLGDSALTINFGNVIDEKTNEKVLALFKHLKEHPIPGMIESVPAYSSLSIYYDVHLIKKINKATSAYSYIVQQVHELIERNFPLQGQKKEIIEIPVCYDLEFGIDLEEMAVAKKLNVEEIIHLHCSRTYRVYMLGFLPGFAYMGEVDERITMPRKNQPRKKIERGSVGIAGKQTGIYPLDSPGGWQIIGRTPLTLFDPSREKPTLLQAGDTIQFYSITKNEFEDHQAGTA